MIPINISQESSIDYTYIQQRADKVIAGFLSLGKKDGLEIVEGDKYETGCRFIRCMFVSFYNQKKEHLSEYKDILTATLKTFSVAAQKIDDTVKSKATLDFSIKGWKEHGVTRLTGNLCKEPRENGPFIEVLINSSASSVEQKSICPFTPRIMLNKTEAIARKEKLQVAGLLNTKYAYPIFYKSQLQSPSEFIDYYKAQHNKDPGPNSLRFLNGLSFLENQQMSTQTAMNCWMKQPKRGVLVSLYLECLTKREELSPAEAWALSRKLYKRFKEHTLKQLETMLYSSGLTLDLIKLAKRKINKRLGITYPN